MKKTSFISFYKKDLADALKVVSKAISKKAPLPILECVLFFERGGKFYVAATDLDISVACELKPIKHRTPLTTDGDVNGYCCIFYTDLKGYLLGNSNEVFNFETTLEKKMVRYREDEKEIEETQVNTIVVMEGISLNLESENPSDFPTMPSVTVPIDILHSFTIDNTSANRFIKMIDYLSKDVLRPAMTGGRCENENPEVRCFGTDGGRLIGIKMPILSGSFPTDAAGFIMPQKAISVLKNSTPKGDVTFEVSEKKSHISVKFDKFNIVSRQIDARYPDVRAVLPLGNPNILTLSKKAILPVVKKAIAAASASTHKIVFSFQNEGVTISSEDLDYKRSFTSPLKATYEGSPMIIGFSGRLLIEILNSFDEDILYFTMSTPTRAAVIGTVKPIVNNSKFEEYLISSAILDGVLNQASYAENNHQSVRNIVTALIEKNQKEVVDMHPMFHSPQFALLMPVMLSN